MRTHRDPQVNPQMPRTLGDSFVHVRHLDAIAEPTARSMPRTVSPVAAALRAGDVSAAGLDGYERALWASAVGRDMRTYARTPRFLGRDRLYGAYGELLAEVMNGVFALDTEPRRHLWTVARHALRRSPVTARQLVADVVAGGRAL